MQVVTIIVVKATKLVKSGRKIKSHKNQIKINVDYKIRLGLSDFTIHAKIKSS